MAANTDPIFTKTPNVGIINSITTANNTADITTGTSYLGFTAGSNGSYVSFIRVKANPANNTAATVFRVWANNGSATGTAANSNIITEVTIAATTAAAAAALMDTTIPINAPLMAGWRLYFTVGTAPGGSGAFSATTFGGDY